jgi:periplasmic protein TonB
MEAGNIMGADILDIIFDGRNKAYGAYDLRSNYRRRLIRSLLVMLLLVVLLVLAYLLGGSLKRNTGTLLAGADIILDKVDTKQKKEEVIIPPVKHEAPKIKIIQFTIPKIVDKPAEEEKPPVMDDIDKAKIGTINQNGADDDKLTGPPVDEKKGIIDAPKKQDADDAPFTKVEIESQYPGGLVAWAAFLNRNLGYPEQAAEKEIQGTVIIQFIVDAQGNVSDVMAVSGPDELRTAAVAVIKKSGKWTAAIQNGQKVKSYKKQPVTFKITD